MNASSQSDSTWISWKGRTCRVNLPPLCRDKEWARERGKIQACMMQGTPPEYLHFNFVKCEWIDPLPLMSIVLEVIHARSLGIKVNIFLPDSTQDSKRLLEFIEKEGFYDCLHSLQKGDEETKREGDKEIKIFDEHEEPWSLPSAHDQTVAAYKNAQCLPMMFFKNEKLSEKSVTEKIKDILPRIDIKLGDKISPHEREWLIYKLQLLLQETLCNICEHAYEENIEKPRLAIIYVRYRIGGAAMMNTSERADFDRLVQQEVRHCPRLGKDWLEAHKGCLEVFVLDRGRGMLESIRASDENLKKDPNLNFGTIMKEAFSVGRSRKKERTTPITGLQLLHDLLKDSADFIRGHEEDIWFGGHAPIERETETVSRRDGDIKPTGMGLALHFRLSWKAETCDNNKWGKFEEKDEIDNFWKELSRSTKDCEVSKSIAWFKQQAVLDERFTPDCFPSSGASTKWLLWLVSPNRMKNDIQSKLEKYVKEHTEKGEKTILIIADIPYYEARTYEAALENYSEFYDPDEPTEIEDSEWLMRLDKIILCTNRWHFSGLSYEPNQRPQDGGKKYRIQHGFSKLTKDIAEFAIPNPLPSQDPDDFNLILWIARWLKWHDSSRLWMAVKGAAFIPKTVIWNYQRESQEHTYINGYLDFARTIRNPLCLDIYRSALARIWGILPSIYMENLDLLTMTVLKDIQAEGIYGGVGASTKNNRLKVGSVLVSGATWHSAEETGVRVLHFFMHENTKGYESPPKNCATLLFWIPDESISNEDPTLRRIGKTAFIAPEGWKSFEIPRFDESGEHPIGHRRPSETYQDWQVSYPSIVKMGHWAYQEHHDFLTINIRDVVKTAFANPNELAKFLVNNILGHLGIKKKDLLTKYQPLIDESSSQKTPGILVYRSHPNTDFIIRKLLEMLVEDEHQKSRTEANQRIFPILPVRVRWGGSTLLMPPLMRKEIRTEVEKDPSLPILIFDDAIISGRTMYNLQAILTTMIQGIIADQLREAEQIFKTPNLAIKKQNLKRLVEIAKGIPEEDTRLSSDLFDRASIHGDVLHKLQNIIDDTIQENSQSKTRRSSAQTSVSMVVIVNRMRLSTDIGAQLKYYWRQDVPTLGKDGSCPLCHAINLAEKFKGSLASKASQNLLENFITPWKATSPIENWNLGLQPQPLQKAQEKWFCYRHTTQKPLDEIKLTHSTGLAIHASELHSMTGDDEYFLKHISEFVPAVRIELIASQLFLFADEFDVKTKIKSVQHLLEALIGLKNDAKDMMRTGLAILAAMRVTTSFSIEQRQKIAGAIDDGLEKLERIALAWMVKENLLTQDDEKHREAYEIGCGMLRSKASLLNCLVKELFSYHGYTHSGAIPRLRDSLNNGTTPKDEEIKSALDSLEEIEYLDEEIKKFHLTREKTDVDKQNALRELQTQAEKALKKRPIEKKEATAKILNDYIEAAKEQIIKKYFFQISNPASKSLNDCTSEFQSKIRNLIGEVIEDAKNRKEKSSEESVEPDENIDEGSFEIVSECEFGTPRGDIWIPWYDAISEAIKNAISNVRHTKKDAEIQNPWSDSASDPEIETDLRKMWIQIFFKQESVQLAFANSPETQIDTKTFVGRHPDRWSLLEDIGGNVELENVELKNGETQSTNKKACPTDVLIVKIKIPYAIHLIQKESTR